ncbi:MAG: radical SAM protein [archaeon]|nr:radical SAM protein [archaeon]
MELVPKILTIETIFGCNAHCTMCPVSLPAKREKGIMPVNLFNSIITDLSQYSHQIEMVNLFALGEPLLDPYIFDRIKYTKHAGFRNVNISTNADLLNPEKQRRLLESDVDSVMFSIDGIKKETHENIRHGVNFERVMENALGIIDMRNSGDYDTRFIVRFINQESNQSEWNAYRDFWKSVLSKEKRDMIIRYDMHNWGGEVFEKNKILGNHRDKEIESKPCPRVYELLNILVDGTVPLCHEDWHHALYNFGNVKNEHPIAIFNSPRFNEIRRIHEEGRKNSLELCKDCTALYTVANREIINL